MEPFSLLPFLQTLISHLPDSAKPAQNASEPTQPPAASTAEPYTEPPTENACWQFFAMHDERVKRTKK